MFYKEEATFTAIDFETANAKYNSICQVGLVRVEQGQIVRELDILVQPPGNKYHWGNSRVHGIRSKDTLEAPTFDEVWHLMEPFVYGEKIVAHNAQFDTKCLRSTLDYYGIDIPPFISECTVKIYKRNLKALCDEFNIELKHHNALSDAKACAQLYLKFLRD